MDEIIFSEDYYEYKEGFANGVIDFIISVNTSITYDTQLNCNNLWDLGYQDAYNYYIQTYLEKRDNKIDLSNISNVINEFYLKRIEQYNELNDDFVTAFTLIIKPKITH